MIFGFTIQPWMMVAGGLTLFTLLVFQVLVGLRKIRLGKNHLTWHKWTAYTMLVIATFHGFAGLLFTGVLRFG